MVKLLDVEVQLMFNLLADCAGLHGSSAKTQVFL